MTHHATVPQNGGPDFCHRVESGRNTRPDARTCRIGAATVAPDTGRRGIETAGARPFQHAIGVESRWSTLYAAAVAAPVEGRALIRRRPDEAGGAANPAGIPACMRC